MHICVQNLQKNHLGRLKWAGAVEKSWPCEWLYTAPAGYPQYRRAFGRACGYPSFFPKVFHN